jgi:hypothetical protein
MDNSDNRLQDLFDRYYNGTATAREKEELMALVRSGEHDALWEELLKNHWGKSAGDEAVFTNEKSDSILGSILASSRHKETAKEKVIKLNWLRYAAAAVIFLVGFGVWFNFKKVRKESQSLAQSASAKDIKPGSNKALLTLSDGSAIALDQAKQGILVRQGNVEISKQRDGMLVYSAKTTGNATEPGMNTLATPKGGQYEVLLPDGSKVWLNASSSIRFPSAFAVTERKVEITGEAYFEVAKDKKKPFRVKFNDSEVLVLGTSFNIMAYADEKASKTTLVEGSVSIQNVGRKAKLKPGQQAAILLTGQIKTNYIPVDEAVAWRNGMFYFKNADIEEVTRQLSRWYDVEIEFRGPVPGNRLTGSISRNVNLSEIVGMLRYAGVNCEVEARTIIISS